MSSSAGRSSSAASSGRAVARPKQPPRAVGQRARRAMVAAGVELDMQIPTSCSLLGEPFGSNQRLEAMTRHDKLTREHSVDALTRLPHGCRTQSTNGCSLRPHRQRTMEPLWSPVVATGGTSSQLLSNRTATMSKSHCHQLRPVAAASTW
jgi:hypothetical protein